MKLLIAPLLILSALADLPAPETIDREVAARAGGPLAPRAGDAEFLRRISLDLAGTLPTAAEARAFIADPDPAKRVKLVDRLLASSDYPRRMEQVFTVAWLERRGGEAIPDRDWRAFLRPAFAENRPWDKLVRDLLAADGRDPQSRAAVKFFLDGGRSDPHRLATDVGRLFLGKNFLCAQCHNHPSVKEYKQADYMGLYAYLSFGKVHTDPKSKSAFFMEMPPPPKVEFQSVFRPDDKKATGPRLPGGPEVDVPAFEKGKEFAEPPRGGLPGIPRFRPRARFAEDLVSRDYPQFARTSVNRFWFLLMGRGLVHPLDLDHKGNPPSHPELLEKLAEGFMASGYDVKALLRAIVLSDAYQRSGRGARDVRPESYRLALSKPLSAEQMTHAVLKATGNLESLLQENGIPKFVLKDYLGGKSAGPPSTFDDASRLFEAVFGNPPGEPEVEFQPSITHALFLMNDKAFLHWLAPRPGNLVDRLTRIEDPAALAEELYLSVLTRLPEREEKAEVAAHLLRHPARRAGAVADVAWGLLASAEFRLNH